MPAPFSRPPSAPPGHRFGATALLLFALLGPRPSAAADRGLAALQAQSDAFAALAEQVGAATVHISSHRSPTLTTGLEQLLRDFQLPRPQVTQEHQGETTGSGVLIRADGLVLTNHHVVGEGDDLRVTLRDGRQYPGRLVGSDPRTDVALVQIEAPPKLRFQAAPLGDSDKMRIGEWVMAVGHPFDFEFTVTLGILSARGRRNLSSDEIADYLQTDAAINPGSSGGPLFNLHGEIIGINTAIFTPAEVPGNAGIGFAIPSNMAGRIAAELLRGGRLSRGTLGLEVADRPPSEAHPRPGAELLRVLPASPAERAGLRRGDVIVRVGDQSVEGERDLRALVLAAGVGEPLQIEVERGSQTLTLRAAPESAGAKLPPTPADGLNWGGMVLAPPTPARAAALGLHLPDDAPAGALVVLAVAPQGPAQSAGVLPGDVIFELSSERLERSGQLEGAAGRRSRCVKLWRGGGTAIAVLAGLDPN